MKLLITSSLILIFTVSGFCVPWSNGGESKSLNSPKFGTHDWIAYEGYRIASREANLDWIKNNLNAFYIGTEAPDSGSKLFPSAGGGYHDTGACHCVLYGSRREVIRDRAAMRAQQEFNKSQQALEDGNYKLAAFYAGAMAHYIGDLSQFMHLMGEGSRWGPEDRDYHKRFEEVIDKTMDAAERRSTLLSQYVQKKSVGGDNAEEVTFTVAKFTDTGGGTTRTAGWMYNTWLTEIEEGDTRKIAEWDRKFVEQTGHNVNTAINGIAKLLIKLSQ